jgi:ATP-dependent DNA helicase RecG
MSKSETSIEIGALLELGEGQFIEFKESPDKNLPKEMVAFANASGGVIYLGISDTGKIKGIETSNKLRSQIQDLARNCDPPIAILNPLRKVYCPRITLIYTNSSI